MAEIISDDILDAAYEEIAEYSDTQVRSEIKRLSTTQPALLAYFVANTDSLDQEAQELGILLFLIMHKAFEKQFGDRLQRADSQRVEKIADQTESKDTDNQPNLFAYVRESVQEPHEDEPELPVDAQEVLSNTMRTVIDVLNSSVRTS